MLLQVEKGEVNVFAITNIRKIDHKWYLNVVGKYNFKLAPELSGCSVELHILLTSGKIKVWENLLKY